MLDFDTALARLLEQLPLPARERVSLAAALGRVLAEPVSAHRPLPEFDYSAMDGYALKASDAATANTRLPLSGTSSAGSAPATLVRGTAMRIFTGAPIPLGADAVAMQENVESDGQAARFLVRPAPGDHVRRSGEDLQRGQRALPVGLLLNAFHLGLAAALDYPELVVAKRPQVSILCTGDELRRPGSNATSGSIPESNGVALAAMAHTAGGTVHHSASSSDEPDATSAALENALALGGELVVTVGGVSVGDRDIVRGSLEALGVTTVFHKVAIKPGKPLYFGRRGKQCVLGLPGNPASAQVTFALFGVPLLRALQGMNNPLPQRIYAALTAPIVQKAGRRGFHRGTLDGRSVTPLGNQASGANTAMAWSNALIVVPETVSRYDIGEPVEVIPFWEF